MSMHCLFSVKAPRRHTVAKITYSYTNTWRMHLRAGQRPAELLKSVKLTKLLNMDENCLTMQTTQRFGAVFLLDCDSLLQLN